LVKGRVLVVVFSCSGALVRGSCSRLRAVCGERRVARGVVLSVLLVTAATGCGGSGDGVDPGSEPNAVVVQVGGHGITRAAFAHAFIAVVRSHGPHLVVPVPPDFTACIKHLGASPAVKTLGGSAPSVPALKSECEAEYESLVRQALQPLISQQWVIGGAAELGVSVTESEMATAVKDESGGEPKAKLERELAFYGETLADFLLRTRVEQLGEGIRRVFMGKTEHISREQVANYYNDHRQLFGIPKGRVLEIVLAANEAQAREAEREIASGRSFASVAKRLSLAQPIYSIKGLVSRYEPKLYHEPVLNNAIFAARPNVLSRSGNFVFEVRRTLPGIQYPLAQVKATIRKTLSRELFKKAFSAWVAEWRARWRARTVCRAGYVVQKCSEFKASSATPVETEDSYTLN
jgi:foldase protein PrsA